MTPRIYRTHDYGETWTKIVTGLASNAFVRAVREDPGQSHPTSQPNSDLLFAATESGVYFSVDDGDHWNALQLNLPVAPIHDLAVKNNDIIIATHGRSFWVLDDIAPLRELSSLTARNSVNDFLFLPSPALRLRRSVNNDTPLPPEEPQGENPPSGAVIYYFLDARNAGAEVKLEILDQAGQLVRRYSSKDQPRTPRQPPPFPDYWLPKQEILNGNPGMHRLVWDLRYASPAPSGDGYSMAVANLQTEPSPQGPLVVPGLYRVRVTAAGKSYEQPLQVGPDPRVKTTQQEFAQQFALAKRIYDGLLQAGETIRQLDERRAQLKQQANPDLERKLIAIAGAARGEEEGAVPPSSVTLHQVNAALGHLLGVIESADAPATKQAAAAAEESLTQLDALLAQAKALGAW